jgi:hypothetical protein
MEQELPQMPSLVIELCRRCDGRFLARIVRYGQWIGFKLRRRESEVVFLSRDHKTQAAAIKECQSRAEKKRWGELTVGEDVEDLPPNNVMLSGRGKTWIYKPREPVVYHDPEMHKTIQKVN